MKPPETESKIELTLDDKLNAIPPLPKVRIQFAIYGVLVGFAVFLLGAKPELFGLDRSPVIGFIQLMVMVVGLGIICLAGYQAVHALWRRQTPSITADFGMRILSTGYVITIFCAMADVFGIGSHPLPGVPVFGVWQARGMEIGLGIIALGFVMMFPYTPKKN
jgi:hypothetical protein